MLLLLIANIFCEDGADAEIGKNEKRGINPQTDTGLIYIKLSEFLSDETIYLCLKSTYGNL